MKTHETEIRPSSSSWKVAFTLLEMLMVIGIIGILAALTAPTIRSLGRGDVMTTALRQLSDDLNLARLRAINGRTPVYVVFFPRQSDYGLAQMAPGITNYLSVNRAANRLLGGQMASYALFAGRTLGDQPGQPTAHYLTEWKTLPRGVYIETNVFYNTNIFFNNWFFPFTNIPQNVNFKPAQLLVIPDDSQSSTNNPLPLLHLPYIVFDSKGQLAGRSRDVLLPIATGALNYKTDPPFFTNYSIANPTWVQEPGDRGLDITGNIRPGVAYVVSGIGTVTYNGVQYFDGQVFYGVAGVQNVTILSAPPFAVGVREVNGIAINWLTGRSRIHRPESLP
jgi:prepilin-type N-terminal cleavage/methylation domain-containing protein